MDLPLFGLFAVAMMLVCYALEDRSAWFVLAFAGTCALASIYALLQGAWPFGLVEVIFAFVALRRWWLRQSSETLEHGTSGQSVPRQEE